MKTRTVRSWSLISVFALAMLTSNPLPAMAASAVAEEARNSANNSKDQRNHGRPEHSYKDSIQDKHEKKEYRKETFTAPQNSSSQQESRSDLIPTPAPVETQPITLAVHNPAGNNGFIKINEEVAPDSIPNNDPHVTCTFNVEFYNYDANPDYYATVDFAMHAPTNKGHKLKVVLGNTNPFIGQDAAGGGNDLDAFETYKLAFTGEPHDKHGYHVKVTIHADGSRGNDVKHKVFWVHPCAAPATSEKPEVNGTTNQGHTLSDSTTRAETLQSNVANLPNRLPSTGITNLLLIAAGLVTMTITYAIILRSSKKRGLHF